GEGHRYEGCADGGGVGKEVFIEDLEAIAVMDEGVTSPIRLVTIMDLLNHYKQR
ncbi:hypothetical protein KI387_040569, partial [Taxus chinensis]